jgi:hypothetical protein
MTEAQRELIASGLDYFEARIHEMWRDLPKARTAEGRAALLESIGDLRADRRRFEIANGESAVAS